MSALKMPRELLARIPMPSEALAEAALKALRPEAERPPSDRFEAEVWLEGNTLCLRIRARDTSSLRAAFNSFFSWLKALGDACRVASSR